MFNVSIGNPAPGLWRRPQFPGVGNRRIAGRRGCGSAPPVTNVLQRGGAGPVGAPMVGSIWEERAVTSLRNLLAVTMVGGVLAGASLLVLAAPPAGAAQTEVPVTRVAL